MNQINKRLFAIVLVGLLCLHFFLIFIYCTSLKIKNQKLNYICNLYIYPVFHQNWGLFVPAPNTQRKLFVRYKNNNEFTNWQDILNLEIMNHKKNRLLGGETKVLLLSNSLIYELNSLDGVSSHIYNKKPINKEFEVLQFEVNQYLKNYFKVYTNTKYELMLVSTQPDKNTAYYMQSLITN